MQVDMKIVVLVVLCVSMAQGRSGDPGNGNSDDRRELLLKALADLRNGNAKRGSAPNAMMKRYPAGPQYLDNADRYYQHVDNAGRDYPPSYSGALNRYPTGLRDVTDDPPESVGETVDESNEEDAYIQQYNEMEGIVFKAFEAMTGINEDLADIGEKVIEMKINACGEPFVEDSDIGGGEVPDANARRQSQGGDEPDIIVLADEIKERLAGIATLLYNMEDCSGGQNFGDEDEDVVTEAPPEEYTTPAESVDSEEPTVETPQEDAELPDSNAQLLERDLLKKLLADRITELSKKGTYSGK